MKAKWLQSRMSGVLLVLALSLSLAGHARACPGPPMPMPDHNWTMNCGGYWIGLEGYRDWSEPHVYDRVNPRTVIYYGIGQRDVWLPFHVVATCLVGIPCLGVGGWALGRMRRAG